MLFDLALCLLTATPTLRVEIEPGRITAGRLLVGRATLDADNEILTGEAVLRDQRFPLHPEPGGSLPLLLPVALDTPEGPARLLIDVVTIAGERLSSLTEVTLRAHLPPVPDPWERLDPAVAALADPEVAAAENDALSAVLARLAPGRRRWEGQFHDAVRGPVIARFGARRTIEGAGHEGPLHLGVDFERRQRASVATMAPGDVVLVRQFPLLGETVVVDHGQGIATLYAHLDIALVAVGDRLAEGAVLGWAGSSGLSDGVMVHVGAFAHGVPIDPAVLLDLPRWLRRPIDGAAADALDARRAAQKPTSGTPGRSASAAPATTGEDPADAGDNRGPLAATANPGNGQLAEPAAPVVPTPVPTATPVPVTRELPPLQLPPALAPSIADFLRELHLRLHQQLPDALFEVGIGPPRVGAPATDVVVIFHDVGSIKFQRATQLAIELTGRLAPASLSSSSRLTVMHAPTQTTIPLLIRDARGFVSAEGAP